MHFLIAADQTHDMRKPAERKIIVITGSTRGIGLGLAREFLVRGHAVIINGRSDEKVAKILNELKKINPEVTGVAGDVSNEGTHLNLAAKSVSEFGKIDIWINNAGIPQPYKLFSEIENKEMCDLIDTNISGLIMGTRTAANQMLKQGFGKIFNMEGFGSNGRTMNKLTLYGTSKRAVNYFTRSAAKELKNSPVQIGYIRPGMVRTDFIDSSMTYGTAEEKRRFNKVYYILAEDVDVVSPFLVKKILRSYRDYDSIKFLSGAKMFVKMFKLVFSSKGSG